MRSTGAEFNLAKCMNSVSGMTERDASFFLKKKTNARLLIKFLFVLNGYERARLFGCACCCQGNEHSPEYCSYKFFYSSHCPPLASDRHNQASVDRLASLNSVPSCPRVSFCLLCTLFVFSHSEPLEFE